MNPMEYGAWSMGYGVQAADESASLILFPIQLTGTRFVPSGTVSSTGVAHGT